MASATRLSPRAGELQTDRIAFHGTLQQLVDKVESGEMAPRLQASHASPCKFWTAFQIVNGIRHMAPVIHGPKGCTYSVANAYKMGSCEYRGVPLEPTSCTAQDEADFSPCRGRGHDADRDRERRRQRDRTTHLCLGSSGGTPCIEGAKRLRFSLPARCAIAVRPLVTS